MIKHPAVINELFESTKWKRDNFKYKLTVLVSSVDAVELAEFEDILLSATAKAFRRFKPKLKTKFTSYLHRIYINKFKDFRRHLYRLYKRKALYFGEQSSEPASNLSENGNYYLKFFKSKKDRELITLVLLGYNQKEIMAMWNLRYKAYQRLLEGIRNNLKFRDALMSARYC